MTLVVVRFGVSVRYIRNWLLLLHTVSWSRCEEHPLMVLAIRAKLERVLGGVPIHLVVNEEVDLEARVPCVGRDDLALTLSHGGW